MKKISHFSTESLFSGLSFPIFPRTPCSTTAKHLGSRQRATGTEIKRSKHKIQNGGEIGSFLDDRSFGMAHTDDQWVRLFNVSDPRRAYAGHTLYKVTSKVTKIV